MSRQTASQEAAARHRSSAAAAGAGAGREGQRTVHRRTGPDLRLMGLLGGTWLATLLALRLRPGNAVILGVTALGAATLGGCLWWLGTRSARRRAAMVRHPSGRTGTSAAARQPIVTEGRRLRLLGLLLRILLPVLLGAGAGAFATAARTQARYEGALPALVAADALVRAEVVLTSDPQPLEHFAYLATSWLVDATMERYAPLSDPQATTRLRATVIVFGSTDRWRALLPGQHVVVTAQLEAPQRTDLTAAVLSVRAPPTTIGQPPWYQRAAGGLRAGLRDACQGLPAAPGGLLPGLVDGDTSTLDPIVKSDFTSAGMTHLTAVSGSNLAIFLGFVMLLARWSRAGPRVAAVAGAAATVGFVVLVRPDPSVLRAALMGGLSLVALALHRPRAAVPGLAAAGFLLLLADPSLAVQLGFVLSVLATLGLLLWAPPWREALRRRGVPAGIAEIVAVSAAADLACAPVIAGFTGSVGLAAIPANVLAEPAVAPATVLGVAAAALSPVTPPGAHLLAWLASWPCRWLVLVARYAAQAPAAVVPWPTGTVGATLLAGILLASVALAAHRQVRRAALVVAVVAALILVPVRWVAGGWPPAGWMFVACDVGQGDGLVLNAAPGEAVVVDTGPEPTAIDRCLRTLGVRSVPLLVLTHDDADHISGITGVFDSRRVGAVAVSRYRAASGGRARVVRVATEHGLTPFPVPPGWSYQAGALHIQALVPAEPITGTDSDSNNNCVVLRVTGRGTSVLLTGDAGPEEQQALRESRMDLHADVLKVPHHGSAYQDPGFAPAVAPRVAVISVGDNDYGQPDATVIRRLRRSGIEVLRTDHGGDVAVTAAGGTLSIARHTSTSGSFKAAARAPVAHWPRAGNHQIPHSSNPGSALRSSALDHHGPIGAGSLYETRARGSPERQARVPGWSSDAYPASDHSGTG